MAKKKRPKREPRSYHVDSEVADAFDEIALDNETSSSALVRIAMKNELARLKKSKRQ